MLAARKPLLFLVSGAVSVAWLWRKAVKAAQREKEASKPNRNVIPPHERRYTTPLDKLPAAKNQLLLDIYFGRRGAEVPVWIMRQAGRYLPEFKEVRKSYSFFQMCQTPEVACEVTLQPKRRYPQLDGMIIFSDILIVPQAMGLEVLMVPGKGPVLPQPIRTPSDLNRLVWDPNTDACFAHLYDAINLTRQQSEGSVPLLGFCGGPWTLMAYMIEGGGSKAFTNSKRWLYEHPEEAHRFLDGITTILVDLLVGAFLAGAQGLQVFESHAGELAPDVFREFSLRYLLRIAREVKGRIAKLRESGAVPASVPVPPMIVFPRGAMHAIEEFCASEYDCLGIDWSISAQDAVARVRKECARTGKTLSLQGNLDPCILFADKEVIRDSVFELKREFDGHPFVANLGHGMLPSHDPEQLRAYIEAVKEK